MVLWLAQGGGAVVNFQGCVESFVHNDPNQTLQVTIMAWKKKKSKASSAAAFSFSATSSTASSSAASLTSHRVQSTAGGVGCRSSC